MIMELHYKKIDDANANIVKVKLGLYMPAMSVMCHFIYFAQSMKTDGPNSIVIN